MTDAERSPSVREQESSASDAEEDAEDEEEDDEADSQAPGRKGSFDEKAHGMAAEVSTTCSSQSSEDGPPASSQSEAQRASTPLAVPAAGSSSPGASSPAARAEQAPAAAKHHPASSSTGAAHPEQTPPNVMAGGATSSTAGAAPTKRKAGGVTFGACTDYEVVMEVAAGRGWRVHHTDGKAGADGPSAASLKVEKCNVVWTDRPDIEEWLRKVDAWQKVNHFPGLNHALARKTRLARNMARMQRLYPKDYRFLPPTWVLPDQFADLERRFDPSTGESKAIFIAKPDHQCQGRGIFLTTNLQKLKTEVAAQKDSVVVQQYIRRPMLIDGLKFDLRLYFLITGIVTENGLVPRYYLFRDGLVRLCTKEYQPPTAETMNDRCMHLTNYAINKRSSDFQQNDGDDDGAGSKRKLSWFMNYVEQEFGEKERKKLWSKFAGLCVKMQLAVHPTLDAEYQGVFPKDLTGGAMPCRCFEILGVDVMLDSKRKPYLIEINHLPSFTCDSPLDQDIKERLIEQTLDLTCGSISGDDKKVYEGVVRERIESRSAKGSGGVAARRLASPATRSRDASNGRGGPVGSDGYPPRRSAPSPSPPPAAGPGRPVSLSPVSPSAPEPILEQKRQSQAILDVESYRDFERVYPATAENATAKQAALYDKILERVTEIFRPVTLPKRPPKDAGGDGMSAAPAPLQQQRPPRPPASAAPGAAGPRPPQSGHTGLPPARSASAMPLSGGASASGSHNSGLPPPQGAVSRSRSVPLAPGGSAPGSLEAGPSRCAGLAVVQRRLEAARRSRSSSLRRSSPSAACPEKPPAPPARVCVPMKTVMVGSLSF
eukprot:TRINITY_DN38516_c0_g1_i1.p1 TRINITY_DN38516_c0_g1~~TRINITY_DN38516_c0_g1_i1.p1  ORF type:complete len:827 (-),score=187.30 TRINITY_DN38516_c0_g1_i1:190-2670(-)